MVDRLTVYGLMVNAMSLAALAVIYVGSRFFHGRRMRDYLPVLALMYATSYILYEAPVLSWSLPGAIPLLEDIAIYTVLVAGFTATYLVKPGKKTTQAIKILYPALLTVVLLYRNTVYWGTRGGEPAVVFYLIGSLILTAYLWRSSLGHYLLAGAFYTEWLADYRELDNIITSWGAAGFLVHMKLWTPWIALAMKPDILGRDKKSVVVLVGFTVLANIVDYYQSTITYCFLGQVMSGWCWLLCPLLIRATIYPVIYSISRSE